MAKQTINYQPVADEVNNLLIQESEWISRFAGYASSIENNEVRYKQMRKKFRVRPPLYAYTSVSTVKGTCQYDLRFKGQSIATVSVDKAGNVFVDTADKDKSNEEYFGCTSKYQLPKGTAWHSAESINFRKHFRDIVDSVKAKSPEHTHESMLLSHFRLSKSIDKKILNIQPVVLSDNFFQMPTGVSASKKVVKSSRRGGGIDILARVRKGTQSTLTIIELKDENKQNERPEVVIKQAIAYATFIIHLLRSRSGNQWWKIFGFGRNKPNVTVPAELSVYAVVAMPGINIAPDFVGDELKVGNDKIILHYLTYSEKDYILQNVTTSLPECQ